MSLQFLLYVSTASAPIDDAGLARILESSVRYNREKGLTGILLYGDGNFMQMLEGEAAALDEALARITGDSRHHSIFVLDRAPLAARQFGQWYMSYAPLSAAALEAPAFLPLRRLAEGHPALAGLSPAWRDILRGFSDLSP